MYSMHSGIIEYACLPDYLLRKDHGAPREEARLIVVANLSLRNANQLTMATQTSEETDLTDRPSEQNDQHHNHDNDQSKRSKEVIVN